MVCFRLKTGEPVHKFCKRSGLAYVNVYRRLDKGLSPDLAVKIALSRKGHKDNYCKYYFKGASVRSQLSDADYNVFLRQKRKGASTKRIMKLFNKQKGENKQ